MIKEPQLYTPQWALITQTPRWTAWAMAYGRIWCPKNLWGLCATRGYESLTVGLLLFYNELRRNNDEVTLDDFKSSIMMKLSSIMMRNHHFGFSKFKKFQWLSRINWLETKKVTKKVTITFQMESKLRSSQ